MAFDPSALNVIAQPLGDGGLRFLSYRNVDGDDQPTVTAPGYFAGDFGLRPGDMIFVNPPPDAYVRTYIIVVESLSPITTTATSISIADVAGLQSALDGKAATVHTHAVADVTGLQNDLDGKAPTSHTHAIADVTGLQGALDGKAASSHTHTLDQIQDIATQRLLGRSTSGTGDIEELSASAVLALLSIASGEYTPALTSVANVSSLTAFAHQYARIGSFVVVAGRLNVTPTSGGETLTTVGIALPVASDLAGFGMLWGTGSSYSAGRVADIGPDDANNRASLSFLSPGTGAYGLHYVFCYRIA